MQSSFDPLPFGHALRVAQGVPPPRRAGFTLVELLAALGISLLLIAAVSASIDIYLRVTTTGQVAIERQQVTRAIFDQMTRDVSSVVFWPAETAAMEEEAAASSSGSSGSSTGTGASAGSGSDTGGGSQAGADGADSMTLTVQDPQSAWSTTNLGIVGDSQMLVLHVSWPQANLSYVAPGSTMSLTDRTSDRLSVSYFMALPGGDGLSGAVAALQASKVTDVDDRASALRSPAGLARLAGDQMAIDRADEQMDDAALAASAKLIAPEIASLSFRYFDGQEWVDSWDSTAMDALPLAIEVTLGYRDEAAEADLPTGLSSVVPIGQTVRHVIHVPLADPSAGGSAL